MQAIEVISDPAVAVVALEPMRSRLLAELTLPASAATLSKRVGITRQKVHYHLKALEDQRLVRPAGERQWGGLTERLMVASASAYVVSPAAMGRAAVDPDKTVDRLSAAYLISLAARAIREVGALIKRAHEVDKRLATLSIDTEVRFRSPSDRAAFTEELSKAVMDLARKYHDASAADGRSHRLVLMAHPLPYLPESKAEEMEEKKS